jgi:hypothetical protein
MYAQVIEFRAPLGKMAELRHLIKEEYLPSVQLRDGFVAAHFLEQIDDHDRAELILFCDSQAAIENMHRTGMLQASVQSLAASLPGLKVQRQGFIVHVSMTGAPDIEQAFAS